MIRWMTAGFVLVLVACGGGGGGGGGGAPALSALFPITGQPTNTVYFYDVTKTVSYGSPGLPTFETRGFHIDHTGGLDKVARFFGFASPGVPVLDVGAATTWSSRGLEAVAFGAVSFNSLGGPCVTVTTPGMLVVPTNFQPGDTHSCTIPGLLDQIDITWVGPEASSGHPDAQRFDFTIAGPYTGSGSGVRGAATRVTVIGTAHLAPGVGPVDGTVTQRFLAGAVVLETRTHQFSGLLVQPPP